MGFFVVSTQGGHHENFLPGTKPQLRAHLSFRKRIEGLDEILAHQTGVFRNFFDAAMARCAPVVDHLSDNPRLTENPAFGQVGSHDPEKTMGFKTNRIQPRQGIFCFKPKGGHIMEHICCTAKVSKHAFEKLAVNMALLVNDVRISIESEMFFIDFDRTTICMTPYSKGKYLVLSCKKQDHVVRLEQEVNSSEATASDLSWLELLAA